MAPHHEVLLAARNNKAALIAERETGCRALPLDVARAESVRDLFLREKPDVVVHAAATKFVDRAERQPLECVDVNVIGSENVARAAIETGVGAVLGISTDKASPPVRNTYGLSKALMERMYCALDGTTDTRFACVRYGNVAWSTGSVLPIWRQMHADTGVIGTTGPEMRRFFFTIGEAVELVVVALKRFEDFAGQVLSREMRAAQIQDLLDTWIELHGGTWERIEGRPGERDDEFLIGDPEVPYTTPHSMGGVEHYAISFETRSPTPIPGPVSSATVPRMTRNEMATLINAPKE